LVLEFVPPKFGASEQSEAFQLQGTIYRYQSFTMHHQRVEGRIMPRGDKSTYTDKQKRKAAHIEAGYRAKGLSEDEAEKRAWATVNKESGGGNKSGSGVKDTKVSSRKGGKLGGRAAASRPVAARSASARKAAATRKRNEAHHASH
jgi:hypothetical protein